LTDFHDHLTSNHCAIVNATDIKTTTNQCLMMNKVFLEIVPVNITTADFIDHNLSMPMYKEDNGFSMFFLTEDDYCKYLKDLENESNIFLSEYWMVKTKELIDKNRFIIRVITVLNNARSQKNPAKDSMQNFYNHKKSI